MSNISTNEKESIMIIIAKKISKKEFGSVKFGIELDDQNIIEAVVFPKDNYTVCLSSQVGCAMACEFCESGKNGFVRNLTTEELFRQFELINEYVVKNFHKKSIGYVVIMGVGEPLLNYENIVGFIRKIKKTKNIKVALCTVGITNNIYRLIKDRVPIKLCISLHATDNAQRRKIMANASRYNFNGLIAAIRDFEKKGNTDSSVDIHYLIFDKLNDKQSDAEKLVNFFKGGNFKIIIKSVCPIKNQKYFEAPTKNTQEFIKILDKNNINYYYSLSRGRDIKGGCGQLRRYLIDKEVKNGK